MRLYHGSDRLIPQPDAAHSRQAVDFGPGFYLTSFEEQASRWALRKAMRSHGKAVVNAYELDEDRLEGFAVKRFDDYGSDWLQFVCECRRGLQRVHSYDIVIGPVADDRVFEAVNMYFEGLWDEETTLGALSFYERNDQFCFATQRAIDALLSFACAQEAGL